jgi:hypothetical protein
MGGSLSKATLGKSGKPYPKKNNLKVVEVVGCLLRKCKASDSIPTIGTLTLTLCLSLSHTHTHTHTRIHTERKESEGEGKEKRKKRKKNR